MDITLGLNLIVGPEDKEELKRCLESCKGELFDEIVVTLAMSEEKEDIKKVAEEYNAKTYFFKWIDDFAAARNFSFEKSTTDYILWCFAPETQVYTVNGLVPISEIKEGDRVLTHLGRFKKVTKVYVREYEGPIYEIKNNFSKNIIRVTPNHEFLSCFNFRGCGKADFCKPSCMVKFIDYPDGRIVNKCSKLGFLSYNLKFNPIEILDKGDIVCFPRLRCYNVDYTEVYIGKNINCKKEIPERLEVTPELMRLFGYYVAEGSIKPRKGIMFTFNREEEEYIKDVLYLMKKYFGVEGSRYYYKKTKAENITFHSAVLSKFFEEFFNGTQPNRRIPEFFFYLSDVHISEFLRGYYRGDGSSSNTGFYSFTSSSKALVDQIVLLLTRFGIMASVQKYRTLNSWKVIIRGSNVETFKKIICEEYDKEVTGTFSKTFYSDSSFMYHQISSYNKTSYKGLVYNLEVEDDHSYVVEYMTVHNCDSDDIIKPSEYEKLLKLKPQLKNWDVVLLNYVYAHDDKDRPLLVLPRERIVKNCDYIKWHDPIHEYLNIDVPINKIARFDINIDHYRNKVPNVERNLRIMKKIYDSGNISERLKFYYGKELADCGKWEEALKILEPYIENGKDFRDNLAVACVKVSKYYLDHNQLDLAKRYALKGIRFNDIYAENYVNLGTVFEREGNISSAIEYYKEAMNKELKGGMSQLVDYYGFFPAIKLAIIYFNQANYKESRKYYEIAKKYKPDNPYLTELERAIEEKLRINNLLNGEKLLTDNIFNKIKDILSNLYSIEIEENNSEFARLKITKKKEISIAWFIPVVDLNNPSIRIRRYNIHKTLLEMGVKSKIIDNYYEKELSDLKKQIKDVNIAIFTQFSKKDLEIINEVKSLGIKCVYDHCEGLFGYPYESECFNACDLIICCSTKLEELTKENGFNHTVVIKDAVEKISDNTIYKDRYEKPKAVYMGMGGNSWLVTEWLRDTIEKAGYELVVISEWDNATKKWNLESWDKDMLECDVALCPQRVDVQPAKSSVKATTAMALGLPVVCSPLQAYKEIIKNGENGFICETFEDWYNALVKLKDSKERERIGKAGRNSIEEFLLPNICKKYISILSDLVSGSLKFENKKNKEIEVKNRPLVDIIITTYNNLEYLKLCLNSIFLNTSYPYHIIISDAGSDEEMWDYLKTLKGITVLGECKKRLSYSEACNAGIKVSNTKYFVILNSDVIVSKGWLNNLVEKMENIDRLASCGVLSNCDRGWLHGVKDKPFYPMRLNKAGIELVPGMKIDQIKPHLEELYEFMEESNNRYKGTFVPQEWVAGYATIYARSAINEVGMFDPLFINGCEDLDLMIRLNKYGYKTGQAIDSFVFHFGGISRGAYQNENKEKYDKEDVENHIKLRKKWKNKKLAIWTGPAWEPWNKDKVDEGMAGSETWASYIAREFVKLGYDTVIYNDLLIEDKNNSLYDIVIDEKTNKEIGKVVYRDYKNFQKDIEYDVIDIFISSRVVEPLRNNIHTIKNFVMIHDVWIIVNDKNDILSWKVNKYSCLSEWHRDFVSQYHNINKDKIIITSNGVNIDLYKDVDNYQKKNQTVYSSSPDRGLYQLLKMLPSIRKYIPDFELIVAYGFYNWETMAKHRKDEESLNFIEQIKKLLNQDGVKYVGRISKQKLAEYQKESKVWLYPTWWAETFCITAVENGLAKNAIITTNLAGLKTTVGHNAGILLNPQGLEREKDYPKEFEEQFIEETVKLLKDEKCRKEWAEKAYEKMKYYSWENVAKEWIKYF